MFSPQVTRAEAAAKLLGNIDRPRFVDLDHPDSTRFVNLDGEEPAGSEKALDLGGLPYTPKPGPDNLIHQAGKHFRESFTGRSFRALGGERLADALARKVNPNWEGYRKFYESVPEAHGTAGNLAGMAGGLGGDLPLYYAASELALASPMGTAAEGLVQAGGIRALAARMMLGGTTFGIADTTNEAMREAQDEGRLNPLQLAKAGGKGTVTGTALGFAGSIPSKLLQAPAEVAALTVAGAATERRMPTVEDLKMNTAMILMLKAGGILEPTEAQAKSAKGLLGWLKSGKSNVRAMAASADPRVVEVVKRAVQAAADPETRRAMLARMPTDTDPAARLVQEMVPEELSKAKRQTDRWLEQAQESGDLDEIERAEHARDVAANDYEEAIESAAQEWDRTLERHAKRGTDPELELDLDRKANELTVDVARERAGAAQAAAQEEIERYRKEKDRLDALREGRSVVNEKKAKKMVKGRPKDRAERIEKLIARANAKHEENMAALQAEAGRANAEFSAAIDRVASIEPEAQQAPAEVTPEAEQGSLDGRDRLVQERDDLLAELEAGQSTPDQVDEIHNRIQDIDRRIGERPSEIVDAYGRPVRSGANQPIENPQETAAERLLQTEISGQTHNPRAEAARRELQAMGEELLVPTIRMGARDVLSLLGRKSREETARSPETRRRVAAMRSRRQAKQWAEDWKNEKIRRAGGEGRRHARRYLTTVLGWRSREVRMMTTSEVARLVRKDIRREDRPSLAKKLRRRAKKGGQVRDLELERRNKPKSDKPDSDGSDDDDSSGGGGPGGGGGGTPVIPPAGRKETSRASGAAAETTRSSVAKAPIPAEPASVAAPPTEKTKPEPEPEPEAEDIGKPKFVIGQEVRVGRRKYFVHDIYETENGWEYRLSSTRTGRGKPSIIRAGEEKMKDPPVRVYRATKSRKPTYPRPDNPKADPEAFAKYSSQSGAAVSMHPDSELPGEAAALNEQYNVFGHLATKKFLGKGDWDDWSESVQQEWPDIFPTRTDAYEWLTGDFLNPDYSQLGKDAYNWEAPHYIPKGTILGEENAVKFLGKEKGEKAIEEIKSKELGEAVDYIEPEDMKEGEVYFIEDPDRKENESYTGKGDVYRVERKGSDLILKDGEEHPINSMTMYSGKKLGEAKPGSGEMTMEQAAKLTDQGKERSARLRKSEVKRDKQAEKGQADMFDLETQNIALSKKKEAEGKQAEQEAPGLFGDSRVGRESIEDNPNPKSVGAAAPAALSAESVRRARAERAKVRSRLRAAGRYAETAGIQYTGDLGDPRPLSKAEEQKILSKIAVLRGSGMKPVADAMQEWLEAGRKLRQAKKKGSSKIKGKKKGKVRAFDTTRVPVPKEGLPLADVERVILRSEGDIRDEMLPKLGQPGIDPDAEGMNRAEKTVHLMRRIMSAKSAVHIDRIFKAEKNKVSEMSRADVKTLLETAARRLGGKLESIDGLRKKDRDRLRRMEKAAEKQPGIASGEPLSNPETKTLRFLKTTAARYALKGLGEKLLGESMLEGATEGMRGAWAAMSQEWSWQMQRARDLFRNALGRHIAKNSVDDQVIFELVDNPEGDEAWIDRESVTLADGTVVKPNDWHRHVARVLVEVLEDLAIRQDLPPEKRRQYYITHVLERALNYEKAPEKLIEKIHKKAAKALGENYDQARLAEGLAEQELTTAKALQILDIFKGKGRIKSARILMRRISAVMGAGDVSGIPKHLRQPYLLERSGNQAYKRSAQEAFEAYLRYSLRKIHLEPAVENAKLVLESLPGKGEQGFGIITQREYGEQWINAIIGRPHASDKLFDGMMDALNRASKGRLSRMPIVRNLFTPRFATRASSFLNRIQYMRLLAFGVDSAMTNLTQVSNTIAEYGLAKTFKGYAGLANPVNWKMIRDASLNAEFKSFFKGPEPIWRHGMNLVERVALFPFMASENINRGAAFMAGLAEARSRGMSFERSIKLGKGAVSSYLKRVAPEEASKVGYTSEAEWFAKSGVIRTQFGYSPVESAPSFSSPAGRLALQFYSFPTQQVSAMYDGVKNLGVPGQRMKGLRYLALIGFILGGGNKLTEKYLGISSKNIWGLKGLLPRGLAPNAQLALLAMEAGFGDSRTARAELKSSYGGFQTENVWGVPAPSFLIPRAIKKQAGVPTYGIGVQNYQRGPLPEGYRVLPFYPINENGPPSRSSRRKGRPSRRKVRKSGR